MKVLAIVAAILTSALLTVPTVTQAANADMSDFRLNA